MFPELFRVPFVNYPVHSYGLMLVVGLLCGIELMKFLARRTGLDPKVFADAAVLALVSGLIGARVAYVIQFHQEFAGGTFLENVWNAINLTSGGLVYYGGFLLAFPTLCYFAVRKGLPLLRSMDIVAPALMIGLGFGRVGCFLNGCCWGQHCELPAPLAVTFPYHSPAYEDDLQNGLVTPPDSLFTRDPVRRVERLLTPDEEIELARRIEKGQSPCEPDDDCGDAAVGAGDQHAVDQHRDGAADRRRHDGVLHARRHAGPWDGINAADGGADAVPDRGHAGRAGRTGPADAQPTYRPGRFPRGRGPLGWGRTLVTAAFGSRGGFGLIASINVFSSDLLR